MFTILLVTASNDGSSPSSVSRNVPVSELPASNSNSSQRLNLSSSLTHSPTNSLHFTQHNWTISIDCLLIISLHGPHRNHRSNSPSTVASRSCRTDLVENTTSKLVHWCMLGISCLATDVVSQNPFLATGLHGTMSFGSKNERDKGG
jgi:hypothetical protein